MEGFTMNKHAEELKRKYMQNPPEGMTAEDIQYMNEDDLLDMEYFLNENIFEDDDDGFFIGDDGFFIF